jgi:hypothetical protein
MQHVDPAFILQVITALVVFGMWISGLIQSRNRLEQGKEIQKALTDQNTQYSTALDGQKKEFSEALGRQQREFAERLDKQQREFAERLDKLRTEFLGSFIPAPLALEQRTTLLTRLDKAEEEIEKGRERVHVLGGKFQELLLGPLQRVNDAVTDQARRLATFEERSRVTEERLRDSEDAISELQRRKAS